jgi:predicted transcriptional regulator
MQELTVNLSANAHEILKQLADGSGETMQTVLESAIETYRRQKFLETANESFRALQSNTEAWEEELAERQLWNQGLTNGLEED